MSNKVDKAELEKVFGVVVNDIEFQDWDEAEYFDGDLRFNRKDLVDDYKYHINCSSEEAEEMADGVYLLD